MAVKKIQKGVGSGRSEWMSGEANLGRKIYSDDADAGGKPGTCRLAVPAGINNFFDYDVL